MPLDDGCHLELLWEVGLVRVADVKDVEEVFFINQLMQSDLKY